MARKALLGRKPGCTGSPVKTVNAGFTSKASLTKIRVMIQIIITSGALYAFGEHYSTKGTIFYMHMLWKSTSGPIL